MTGDLRKEIAELKAQNAELNERLKALEPKPPFKAEPMPPYDPLERVSRPALTELPTVNATDELERMKQQLELIKAIHHLRRHEPWKLELMEAVPTSLVRDIVRDNRGGRSEPKSVLDTPEKPRGTGWVDPAPLSSPPGIKIIDQMMAADDRRWRAERARELGVEPPPKPVRRV